ncbi:MAG: dihydropteroate synthase [Actinomycetota bacterium]
MPAPGSTAGACHSLRLIDVPTALEGRRLLAELGCDQAGVTIMAPKMVHLAVSAENVQARAATIIKQVLLSRGGECATPRRALTADGTDLFTVVMMGTASQLRSAARNLSMQPFGLKALSGEITALLEAVDGGRATGLEVLGHVLPLGERTLVMGVLNVTPDSFSESGTNYDPGDARSAALRMIEAGADIIDVGGESTRPGADPVSLEEELRRTVPLVEALASESVPVSIDTYKSDVASRALDAGACIINDISGLRFDPAMAGLAARREVPVIIMHMQGEPGNMQENPVYDDVVADICRFLRERAACAEESGVPRHRILVDPGIGFGKTVEHNLQIMNRLSEFSSLPYRLVLGTSRKRFIGAVLDRPVDRRLMGTAATLAFAVAKGVDVVRVHDVEQMVEVVRMADAMAAGECADPADRRP